MRFLSGLIIPVILLAGCASPERPATETTAGPVVTAFKPDTPRYVEVRREQLVGWWYGDQPTAEGGRVQWIMRRAPDGTFEITFRTRHGSGRVEEQTEVGEWGVNANFIITLTQGWLRNGVVEKAPGGEAYFWDVYEVRSFEVNALSYRSVESGNAYQVRRVSPGFAFPE